MGNSICNQYLAVYAYSMSKIIIIGWCVRRAENKPMLTMYLLRSAFLDGLHTYILIRVDFSTWNIC